MKYFVSLCAVLVVVAAGTPELFHLAPESQAKMRKVAMPCAEQFNVDRSIVQKLGDDDLPRDESTNKFLHCFGVNSGIIDKDGHIVPERLVSIVGDHPLVEEMKEEIRKCNEITKEDPVATAVAMHICYGQNFPIHFVF